MYICLLKWFQIFAHAHTKTITHPTDRTPITQDSTHIHVQTRVLHAWQLPGTDTVFTIIHMEKIDTCNVTCTPYGRFILCSCTCIFKIWAIRLMRRIYCVFLLRHVVNIYPTWSLSDLKLSDFGDENNAGRYCKLSGLNGMYELRENPSCAHPTWAGLPV